MLGDAANDQLAIGVDEPIAGIGLSAKVSKLSEGFEHLILWVFFLIVDESRSVGVVVRSEKADDQTLETITFGFNVEVDVPFLNSTGENSGSLQERFCGQEN